MRTKMQKILMAIVLFLTTFAVIMGSSSAQTVISVESVENIQNGTTVWINVTAEQITDPDGIGSYRFNLTFDPTVVNVLDVQGVTTKNIDNSNGWVKFNEYFTTPVTENGTVLATLQLMALKNDGSSSPLNLSIEKLYDPDANVIPAVSVNGTFTTLDEVPPAITFSKANGSTVGPELDVIATLYDLSGINASSIEVYINDTKLTNGTHYTVSKVNETTWNVTIRTNVSQLLGVTLPHDVEIRVTASDTKGNTATGTLRVTASEIGFFAPSPAEDSFVNTSDVTISVRYSQISPGSIRMFLDGVNVTSSISIDNETKTVSYSATNLADGIHTVKVNGTGIDDKEYSKEWNFTVDTVAPVINFFEVRDSDGDGFIERYETLTAYWNVSDANFDKVEILYEGNVVKTVSAENASVTFSLTDYGGNITLKACDKAGNSNESSGVYVYNNYVAYAVRAEAKEVMGLNITRFATLDVLDPSVVDYEFIGASGLSLPLQNAERVIVPGTKANYTVIVDSSANKTISRFPSTAVVFNENATLDFYIEAPAKGLIMVIKVNDSYAKDLANDLLAQKSLSFSLENLTELMEYAYVFDEKGWAQAKYDKANGQFTKIGTTRGTFTLQTDINEIIAQHSVDISNGFRLSNHDSNYTTTGYSVRPVLESGYYALLVIGKDNDVTALDLVAPFVVLNGTLAENSPSASSQVMVGEKVTLNFSSTFNAASVLIVKNVDYDASVKVDLTGGLLNALNASLSYGDKPLKEVKLFNRSTNIWLPEGMVSWAFTTKDSSSIGVDTSGLETGEYLVYAVAVDSKYMPLFIGDITVELTADEEPPSIELELVDANQTAIVVQYSFEDNDLLEAALIKATYPDGSSAELLNLSGVDQESLSGTLSVNVASLAEGESITIYAEAKDRSGNSNTLSISYTKPVIANVNETETAVPAPDLKVNITAGANNTVVSLGAVKGKTAKELGVPKEVSEKKPELKVVKAVKVEAKVLNGSVREWTLRVEYNESEISGLDESSLTLFYWNGSDWVDLKELWTAGTPPVRVDATHNMTSYLHDLANNFIEVKMDNLSVFALAASPPKPAAAPAVEEGFGGYAAPTARAYSTPLMTAEGGREVTVTLPSNAFLLTQVSSLKLTPGKTVQLQVIVEKLEKLPYGIPRPAGDVALLLKIELIPSEETTVSGSITFAIERDAISERGIDPDEAVVTLLKYNGNAWIELPTEFVKSDGKYNYYRAETPSFSYFAAIVEAPPAVTPTPTPTAPPETPTPPVTTPTPPVERPAWMWILGAAVVVLILIVAAMYLRRR